MLLVFVIMVAVWGAARASLPCTLDDMIRVTRPIFREDGSLTDGGGITYPPSFWNNGSDATPRRCRCSARTPCYRKCCDEGYVIGVDGVCVVSAEQIRREPVDGVVVTTIVGDPCSSRGLRRFPLDEDEYAVADDGSLTFALPVPHIVSVNEYCFDFVVSSNAVVPLMCTHPTVNALAKASSVSMYTGLLGFSLPFLVVTFIVYASIRGLNNVHGKCLMSHVTTVFVAYLMMVIDNTNIDSISRRNCVGAAFIIYFSFLASFFWLNVMCLDIWWTFSGFRPLRGSIKEREHKKFILYSVYCWGCPLLMLILAMVMDLHPEVPDSYLKPGFGNNRCWFDDDMANLAYFLGPIAALILINMLMFACTAFKIKELKRETKILKRQESKRFYLYVRLFLVMGVNWAAEVVSWACGGPAYLWYVTDVTNTLQGVLIFFIFVWKQRIRRLVWERLCGSHGGSDGNGTPGLTNTQTTSTRFSIRRSTRRSTHANRQVSKYRMAPLMGGEGNKQELVSDTP